MLLKKKFVSLALSAVLASSLAGCTNNTQSPATSAPATSAPAASAPATSAATKAPETKAPEPAKAEAGNLTLPISKEKITLTYWLPFDAKHSATLKNLGELAIFPVIEEKTNIHVEFLHPVAGQETEQFNLMVAGGDLPDLIERNWIGAPGGPEKALQEGTIIDMTDLINKYAPNYRKVLDDNPLARKEVTTRDGKLYNVVSFYLYPEMRVTVGLQTRGDWLEKVNLPMPTTIDEWHTALTAFKEKDLAGGGKTLPLINISMPQDRAMVKRTLQDNLHVFLTAWGISNNFYMQDNKVKFGVMQDEYKEFLTVMKQWIDEGLIDPDFPTTDKKMFDAKITDGRAGLWSAGLMGDLGRFVKFGLEQHPDWKFVSAPFPSLEKGGKNYNMNSGLNSLNAGAGIAITKANKHPEESMKWLDYGFSPEGHILYNFGIEGKSYTMVNGKPTFTDEIFKNAQGWDVTTAIGHYSRGVASMGNHLPDLAIYDARAAYPEQIEAKYENWKNADMSRVLPPLVPEEGDSQKMAGIMNEVYTYADEMVLKFLIGAEPLSNFDKFRDTLKKMGIEDAIAIQQKALDAFNAK